MTHPAGLPSSHTAILGKTGSGKTSDAKLLAESVYDAGHRVCILDSVKSDWWGLTSSADGRSPGLPFTILGGPHGHLPMFSSAGAAVGQLVGSGKLRHSIIDMADFEAGGLQRFFIDFAQALMKNMKGVLYLFIEEAHEFAPKERAGIGAENLAVHWAKKLATAGRSKGIRLVVCTQRIQALHNAVLGSCETLIAHRMIAPADQEPVLKWLKANTTRTNADAIGNTLSQIKTGTAWVCGEGTFELKTFPLFRTFDNSKTPDGKIDNHDVTTAAIDTKELGEILKGALAEAKSNDPTELKKEIQRLEKIISLGGTEQDARDAYDRGVNEGRAKGREEGLQEGNTMGFGAGLSTARATLAGIKVQAEEVVTTIARVMETMQHGLPLPPAPEGMRPPQIDLHRKDCDHGGYVGIDCPRCGMSAAETLKQAGIIEREQYSSSYARPTGPVTATHVDFVGAKPKRKRAEPVDGLDTAARNLLEAFKRYPERGLTWDEACIVAGMVPGNGYFHGGKKRLLDGMHVTVARVAGRLIPQEPEGARSDPMTRTEILNTWSKVKRPGDQMLEMLLKHGHPMSVVQLGVAIDVKPGNGYWHGGLKALKRANLITVNAGMIELTPFVKEARR